MWIVGSESYARVHSGGAVSSAPAGECHAVDPDAGLTACGRPMRSLRVWSELPWQRAGMLGLDICTYCAESVE